MMQKSIFYSEKASMSILFLKTLFPECTYSQMNGIPFFLDSSKQRIFALLPKCISAGKAKKKAIYLQKNFPQLSIIWILPISELFPLFLRKKLFLTLQPLYCLEKTLDGSLRISDRRYLRTNEEIIELPPVEVDVTCSFSKKKDVMCLERKLLFPSRASCFYFKGDTTDRLFNPAYLKRLQVRQKQAKGPLFSPYLFLKNLLDK
jgi:hypothetical protein